MDKKIIIPIIIIVVVAAAAAIMAVNKTENPDLNAENSEAATVKEFSLESFAEFIDGKAKPQFSLKEITVKKGDLVRIKIIVRSGMHDFKIDEFNVYADTKELNKEYTVEFTADKVGEFIYYCAKPGHRASGQWGALTVTE